jgi:hypothetical protein
MDMRHPLIPRDAGHCGEWSYTMDSYSTVQLGRYEPHGAIGSVLRTRSRVLLSAASVKADLGLRMNIPLGCNGHRDNDPCTSQVTTSEDTVQLHEQLILYLLAACRTEALSRMIESGHNALNHVDAH